MVALNFPSVFGQSIILLLVYQALALLLLWAFRASPKPALLRILHLSDESSRVRRQTARSRLPVSPNDVYEGFTAMRWTGWSRARRARFVSAYLSNPLSVLTDSAFSEFCCALSA
jgi:hypothetical protein